MRPILFQWRGKRVYSYPAMFYFGLVCGIVAENCAANLIGLDSFRVFVVTLLLLVPALVGARLLFMGMNFSHHNWNWSMIWRRSEGGAALYGGLPLILIFSYPLLLLLEIPFGAFWDVTILTISIAMIFTRIGCLLNGCCAGRPANGRLALCLPDHDGTWRPRFPTQLLEAGLALVLLILAVFLWGNLPFSGALFLVSLVGYGLGRFVLEFMREQGRPLVGKLTINHAISAALAIIATTALLTLRPTP